MPQSKSDTKRTFKNLSHTPQLAKGVSMFSILKDFLFRPKSVSPSGRITTQKVDLKSLYSDKPALIWFGHSSYLIHYKGKNILVDPVFSGYASPFSFYIKAFDGADAYKPEDMPEIDILIITHNHYDHLDLKTIEALSPKIRTYIMPLGVKEDLKGMNINPAQIRELGWWDRTDMGANIKLIATPARHFSGRGLKRNGSLWASFVLMLDDYRIFIGSDSGYDSHFKEIGSRFGPFDIAILECGQYNTAWPFIHSQPEELIVEGFDLDAKVLMPVHWGKFALALHEWDEPIKRFVRAAEAADVPYTTPMIGQPVVLDEFYPKEPWWES
ncbi:MAG TPA: MBL fold metallo-hydrolase [Sphingobacteriaceae bacterium]